MTPVMTLQFTTPLIGLFFVPKIVALIGKKKMFIASGVCAVLSGALLLIAQTNAILVYAASLCCGLVVTGVFATIWGTMPDTADYGEWKTGVYCPGVITSLAVLATKIGSAIAQWGAAMVLTISGYDATLEVQSEMTSNAIYLSVGIVPIILGIVAIICVLPYDLTPEKLAEITAELEERRKK